MAGVDGDALLVDLRRRLRARPSWGLPQLRELLEELELEHTPDESVDAAVLRRFAAGLTDEFLGRLPPRNGSTDDPLAGDDPHSRDRGMTTSAAMDGGERHAMTEGGHDGSQHRTAAGREAAHA
jgi:hypothetical protein